MFAQIPREAIPKIQKRYFFYVWSEEESVVRWMCSFDTTEADVRQFTEFVERVVRGSGTETERSFPQDLSRRSGPCSLASSHSRPYYFLAALTFAHRAICAAAIRLRPAAEIVRFLRLAMGPRLVAGRRTFPKVVSAVVTRRSSFSSRVRSC